MPVTLADPNFVSGDRCDVGVLIGSDVVTFPADKWSVTDKGMNKDMSNMRDGRFRTAGLPDAEGTFDMKYDTANDPTLDAKGKIKRSAIVDLKLYCGEYNPTTPPPAYAIKAIIDDVTIAAEFQGELTLSVKWSLQSGTLAYPTYT